MLVNQSINNLVDFEIATSQNYEPNWHHELIARELQHIEAYGDRDYKILIVTVPPRHGKSQQCSIDFPAWYLGRNPSKEVIIASYSADLAQEFGGKTRDKVNSEQFKIIFPHVRLKEDEKAKGRWMTNEGGSYTAAGVGGSITGRGANVFLIDDPVKNREEAESEVYQAKTWDWFTSTAFTRLAPNGVVVLIMTRWNLRDLAGKILQHEELKKRTKIIRLAAIAEDSKSAFRQQAEALWPLRFSLKALQQIKMTIGPYDWAALYQGNPILTENQEFKPEWYHYATEAQVAVMNTRRFLSIDTAMSKKTQANQTGFCDNRVNTENIWHLKAWGAKLGPEELVEAIFNLYTTYRYEAIGIEKTSYTEGLKSYLDSEQRRRAIFLPIIELDHKQTSKEIRIRGLIPRYAASGIVHIKGQCEQLEEQQRFFPVGVNDDVLDSVGYQLQLADNPHLEGSGITVHVDENY